MQNIKVKSVGQFMTRLLSSDYFDAYEVESLQIKGACTYNIEGRIHKDFFSSEERESLTSEFVTWGSLRLLCYEMIKGKNTPLSVSIVFHAPSSLISEVYNNADTTLKENEISALLLSVRYDGTNINLVSSTSLSIFSMDKSIDHAWDEKIPHLLSGMGLEFDEM